MRPAACPNCHQIVHTLDGSCPECEGWDPDPTPPRWWEPIFDVVVWASIGFVLVYFGWHVLRAVTR